MPFFRSISKSLYTPSIPLLSLYSFCSVFFFCSALFYSSAASLQSLFRVHEMKEDELLSRMHSQTFSFSLVNSEREVHQSYYVSIRLPAQSSSTQKLCLLLLLLYNIFVAYGLHEYETANLKIKWLDAFTSSCAMFHENKLAWECRDHHIWQGASQWRADKIERFSSSISRIR